MNMMKRKTRMKTRKSRKTMTEIDRFLRDEIMLNRILA